jgi:4-hydroxybenzoate polyprenyltransferase
MSAERLGWNRLGPWLTLGRVSNLPTVWSNCLAAWLMGGGGSGGRFLILGVGATCVYLGGMFLNDALDANFDRQYRRERPIPAGTVGERSVWWGAAGALGIGLILLGSLGPVTLKLALLLVLAVIIYNVTHKFISFSPGLMALCRYLLFLCAGSVAVQGVTGQTAWSAVALAVYIVGLSYIARGESRGGLTRWWPLTGLALPLVLAGFMNAPADWLRAGVAAPALIFALWTLRSLSHLARQDPDGARQTVSGLLAGIVLVDLVALMPAPFPWGVVLLVLFATALVLQRTVPAT